MKQDLQDLRNRLASRYNYLGQTIQKHASRLAQDMNAVAVKVDRPGAVFNSLGEVQGSGTTIDTMVARRTMLAEVLEEIDALLAAQPIEGFDDDAGPHEKVSTGKCPVCGHFGEDCAGQA